MPKPKLKKTIVKKDLRWHAKDVWRQLRQLVNKDSFWIIILASIKLELHLFNVNRFPYIENDEGTYASRAVNFIATGELDTYTYWYDHTPFGWIFMAGWYLITGGTAIFGDYILSGRILMGLLGATSVAMVYILGRKLFPTTKMPSIIAALVITLSPLILYFQRRILLDNIMIFWVLLAFILIYRDRSRLLDVYLAGLAISFGILTKLNAIVFVPVILIILWQRFDVSARVMAMFQFLATIGTIVGSYVMYALLKGEFFPQAEDAASGRFNEINLVDTLVFQSSRGGNKLAPWNPDSNFYLSVVDWLQRDYTLIVIGMTAVAVASLIVVFKRYRNLLPLVASFWMMFAFLARGGVVLGFYFLPLIPFVALLVGWMISAPLISAKSAFTKLFSQVFLVLAIIGIIVMPLRNPVKLTFAKDETTNQQEAVEWIIENVDRTATIAIDNYAYPTLNQEYGYGNADYFFKVEYDPSVQAQLGGTWQNIDYILLTHEMVKQMGEYTTPSLRAALEHSELVASFTGDTSSYIDLEDYISTNGDWAQIYRVMSDEDIVLLDAWQNFLDNYLISYGQVIDPAAEDQTTSELQARAMLMAVRQNDRAWFDGIHQWTRDHLQNRIGDKLFSAIWAIDEATGEYSVAESNNSSVADLDIALALIEAAEQWDEPEYLEAAAQIVDDIWAKLVIIRGGEYYVSAFLSNQANVQYINPGYFSPYHYRQFAQVRPDYNWQALIDDGYQMILDLQANQNGLVQNWLGVSADGSLISASDFIGATSDLHGVESSDLAWRVSLDFINSTDNGKARQVLENLAEFQAIELEQNELLYGAYTVDGAPAVDFEDSGIVANALLAMQVANYDKVARDAYLFKVFGSYDATNGQFGTEPIIHTHITSWLAVDLQRERMERDLNALPTPYGLNQFQ